MSDFGVNEYLNWQLAGLVVKLSTILTVSAGSVSTYWIAPVTVLEPTLKANPELLTIMPFSQRLMTTIVKTRVTFVF